MACKQEWAWSSADGTPIHGLRWIPEGKDPEAAIGIVHGLGEHAGAYAHVADWFTDKGFAVYAFDQRGHGLTAGRRGDCPDYEALLEPVRLMLGDIGSQHRGLPVFLFGHSMGGNVALNYALRFKPDVAGVIASGPWLRLAAAPPPVRQLLGRLRKRLQPGYLSLQANARGTSDPEMQLLYAADPLRHGRITLRTLSGVRSAGRWALKHAHELEIPLLLMHGSADRVTSCRASRIFASRAGSSCTYREWPGFRHELHAERERRKVLAFAADWMDAVRSGGISSD
ncbi:MULTISPECIES: alpha/beta hydrolase [Paenibacillus]|uniref:alpha/beta hydrolase n=1 Tax=Paenibacillus TaxID=44249 RepID=UPI00038FB891|nr:MULTISPECIES: alpha/beta hydrolase [Paenibacillus]KKC49038.1 hypothetical protein VE23_21235 [Paenibacillus sp. D9]CDN42248.1 Alpha/beta hydrolase fold protein [Paenibacillus sp. P22]